MRHLDFYLEQFERNCTARAGMVHWARDAEEARQIVVAAGEGSGARAVDDEVIKIKSMTTEEIQLNRRSRRRGSMPYETDLAELIIQLGQDQPSHIVVPALHKNRQQIREIFQREMNLPELGDTPQDLADAARRFLREKFLRVKTGVSGANFLIAETGGVVHCGERRQRAHVPDAAGDADHGRRDRQGDSAVCRTWRCCCSCCRAARRASG